MNSIDNRLNFLHIPLSLIADQFFQKRLKHDAKIRREAGRIRLNFYNARTELTAGQDLE